MHTPMALKQSLERLGKSFLQVHPLAVDDDRAGQVPRSSKARSGSLTPGRQSLD